MYDYYPFGMETASSYRRQAIDKNNYMFNGGVEYNEDTEWYETAFRQYDPAIGRFGAIDPLTHAISGINPYQYAYNDPVSFNDPTGLAPSGGNLPIPQANVGGTEAGRAGFGGGGLFDGWKRGFDVTVGAQFTQRSFSWDDYANLWNSTSANGVGEFTVANGSKTYGSYDDYLNDSGNAVRTYGGYIVNTDNGTYLSRDRSFEGIGGWYRAQSISGDLSSAGFWSGVTDGFGAGVDSTIDFLGSLATADGWRSVGQGLADFAALSCNCAAGAVQNTAIAQGVTGYLESIPNKSSYELGYDIGFASEKIAETTLISKGVGLAARVTTFSVENIAGFYVRGSSIFVGGTYSRTIQSLASLSENTSITQLLRAFEAQARAGGANRIVLRGIDIVETRLINARAAQRFGYTFKQTSNNSIRLTKTLK